MPETNAPAAHPTASPTENPSAPDSLESHVKSISLERLIHGFPLYFKTAREIVLRPTSFAISLNIKNRDQLGRALEFVSYSIVICFVLLIPTFIAHNEKLSKFTFFARMLTQFAIYGVILHLALKVVGSRTVTKRNSGSIRILRRPLYASLFPSLLSAVIALWAESHLRDACGY